MLAHNAARDWLRQGGRRTTHAASRNASWALLGALVLHWPTWPRRTRSGPLVEPAGPRGVRRLGGGRGRCGIGAATCS